MTVEASLTCPGRVLRAELAPNANNSTSRLKPIQKGTKRNCNSSNDQQVASLKHIKFSNDLHVKLANFAAQINLVQKTVLVFNVRFLYHGA